MKRYFLFASLVAGCCIPLISFSQDHQPAADDKLPIPGKWQGQQQCMTLGRDNPLPATGIKMTVRDNELLSEYAATGRANSKFVMATPDAGLTSESPDFIRSLMTNPNISEDGKAQFERLAAVLESSAGNTTSFKLIPSDNVVSGKMICLAEEKWCHFEATLRVKFGDNAFEVKGGDMLKDYDDRMVIVGYAYDEYSCAPETCVVVCEANLTTQ